MAKRRALIATFFLLALITGITSAQASSIDFTATVISLSGTRPEAHGGGLQGGTMSGQLTDYAPSSGGLVQGAATYTSDVYSDIQFSGGEYTSGTHDVQIQAVVNYTATITQDAANPFQNAAWNAYFSWEGGSKSIVQITRNPADPAGNTVTGSTTIDFIIPFLTSSAQSPMESFWVTTVGTVLGVNYPVTLTLHLEQSGQSAAVPTPGPGAAYLLGSGLVALVGRKLRLRPRKS